MNPSRHADAAGLGKGPIGLSVVAPFVLKPADSDKLRNGLSATGVGFFSAPPRAMPGNRLVGEELLALYRLPWWYGNSAYGEYWIFINPQGEPIVRGSWRPGVGATLTIENEQICHTSPNFCLLIYRNPEGTRVNNDEYFSEWGDGVERFFSAYAERPPGLKGKLIRDE